MNLNELSSGASKKPHRKGRGPASGSGKTAGRGHKGQGSRAGRGVRPGFEGGQMPLYRRLPKRGFNNSRFAKTYAIINLRDLENFHDGDVINLESLMEDKIIAKPGDGLKVLGDGNLTKKITVQAKIFSASAKEKIEAAGGRAEVI